VGTASLTVRWWCIFAKRGATALAVGAGDMCLQGCSGPVVLKEVLHVPELQDPLFSVRAALSCRMSVHFCPGEQINSPGNVLVMQDKRLCFLGSKRGQLYFLDGQSCVVAAMAPKNVQQLTRAWECHRRMGHLGFSTLAGLKEVGSSRRQ
jgi:hypothetical protein